MRFLRLSVLFAMTLGIGGLSQTVGGQSSAPTAPKATPQARK